MSMNAKGKRSARTLALILILALPPVGCAHTRTPEEERIAFEQLTANPDPPVKGSESGLNFIYWILSGLGSSLH